MMMRKKWSLPFVAAAFATLLLAAPPALAGGYPLALVRALYAPYLGQAPMPERHLEPLATLAGPPLRGPLERELTCQRNYLKDCRYPFDVIADGEARLLEDLQLQLAAPSRETVEVVASFKNAGAPATVVYLFRKSGSDWRLTDVRSRGAKPWSLTRLLQ